MGLVDMIITTKRKVLIYPPAYSRWTENRNMQAFQDLLLTGSIDISQSDNS